MCAHISSTPLDCSIMVCSVAMEIEVTDSLGLIFMFREDIDQHCLGQHRCVDKSIVDLSYCLSKALR